MNGKPSDDRISAWLDDELPLSERADIEEQFAGSAEMRLEAEELRQVSELVRGLDTRPAPEELHPSIMRSIERDTLLAGGMSGGGRSMRLSQVLSAAAVAVLLVGAALWLMERGGSDEPVEQPRIVQDSVPPTELRAQRPENREKPVEDQPVEEPREKVELDEKDESREDEPTTNEDPTSAENVNK